jgi:hypothetical protein
MKNGRAKEQRRPADGFLRISSIGLEEAPGAGLRTGLTSRTPYSPCEAPSTFTICFGRPLTSFSASDLRFAILLIAASGSSQ